MIVPARHRVLTLLLLAIGLIVLVLAIRPMAAFGHSVRVQDAEPGLTLQQQLFLADREPTHELQSLSRVPCVAGFAGSYPCRNIDLMAFMPLADIGGGSGNDIWGWTAGDGREIAIMGRTSGTAFVDISDAENPVYLGNLPTHSSNSSWRDIKVFDDHAFIVSEASSHGMQVFDLNTLPLATAPGLPLTFSSTAHYAGVSNTHNIAINESSGYAYLVGTNTCSGGLHMVDINTPTAPVFAGCFSSDGYTHDVQCINYNGPDPDHVGKEICFASNEDSVTIVDVSNKAAPVQIARMTYSGTGYTHQGWLWPNHRIFIFDDELDELFFGHNTRTRYVNVVNLDSPFIIASNDGTTSSIDHNLYVHNRLVYQANYRSGLRVIKPPATEVGYFDIYPSSDSASFNGAWSVYPFFASGNVVVSGIEQGLFILRASNTVTDQAPPASHPLFGE